MTQQLKKSLINEGFSSPDSFKGCTDEEIQQVMKTQNVKRLPATFVEYLRVMGHGGLPRLFAGDDIGFHAMLYLKKTLLNEIRLYSPNFTLPGDAFVFFGHHDYEFQYFLTDNDDNDPLVLQFGSEDDNSRILNNKLSEYFDDILEVSRRLRDKG